MMPIKYFYICLLFACITVAAAPSDCLSKLRYMRELLPPKNAESADISAADFDEHIFKNSSRSFSDVRILDAEKSEIPFLIEQEFISEKKEETLPCGRAKIVSLKKPDDNSVEIIAELTDNDNVAPTSIRILTGNRNYEKTIDVFAGNDMSDWKQIASDQTVFDYSEIIELSKNSVEITPGAFKFYRIAISNFTEGKVSNLSEIIREQRKGEDFSKIEKTLMLKEALKIDGIQFLAKKESVFPKSPKAREYGVKFTFGTDDKGNTEIIVESDFRPLTSFTVETSSANFSRTVSVESSDDRKAWNTIEGSGRISKIDIAGFKESLLKISFPERRSAFNRIKIYNGDAPAVKIDSLKASGNIYLAKFIGAGSGKASIYYSGEKIAAPSYDIGGVLAKVKNPVVGILEMGAPTDNPDFNKDSLKKPFLDNKTLFYVVIGLMVIILGTAIFTNIKKMDSIPEGKNEE